MRRFTFRLEPVRVLREQVETEAKEALARELAVFSSLSAELDAASRRLTDAQATVVPAPGAELTGSDLAGQQAYLERLERERLSATFSVSAQEHQVESKRSRLADAARDREALERLKSRKEERHRLSLARAEEAALGEIALAGHRRNAQERAA
jgi:flagellar FliJ protein